MNFKNIFGTDLLNHGIVCQSNSLLVYLAITSFVDQFSNALQVGITVKIKEMQQPIIIGELPK